MFIILIYVVTFLELANMIGDVMVHGLFGPR